MNLYKIGFTHYSQKDNESGMKEYFLADNDEEVFNYINEKYTYNSWTDEDKEDMDIYDDHFNFIEAVSYKDFILKNHGDDKDESLFDDLYYGQTTYYWELIKENISDEDINKLIELNILNRGLDK